jgi:hypothetical protein
MKNNTNINNELEFNAQFNANEQAIIARFVEHVANQSNQPISATNFNVAESDADIKQNVLDWLDKKYRTKLGRRPK